MFHLVRRRPGARRIAEYAPWRRREGLACAPSLTRGVRRLCQPGTLRLAHLRRGPDCLTTRGGPDSRLGAVWSRLAAREAHNLEVGGSNPPPAMVTRVRTREAQRFPGRERTSHRLTRRWRVDRDPG